MRRGKRSVRTSRKKSSFISKLNTANVAQPWNKWYFEDHAESLSTGVTQNEALTNYIAVSNWLGGINISSNPRPDGSSGNLAHPFANHPVYYWRQAVFLTNMTQNGSIQPLWLDAVNGSVSMLTTDTALVQQQTRAVFDTYMQLRGQRSQFTAVNLQNTPIIVRMWMVRRKTAATNLVYLANATNTKLETSQARTFIQMLNDEIKLREGISTANQPADSELYRLWDQPPTKFPTMKRNFRMRMKQFVLGVNQRKVFNFKWKKPHHLSIMDMMTAIWKGYQQTVTGAGVYSQDYTTAVYGPGELQIYFQVTGVKAYNNASSGQLNYGPHHLAIIHKRYGQFRQALVTPFQIFREDFNQAVTSDGFNRSWGMNPQVIHSTAMPTGPTQSESALPVQLFVNNAAGTDLVPLRADATNTSALQVDQQ